MLLKSPIKSQDSGRVEVEIPTEGQLFLAESRFEISDAMTATNLYELICYNGFCPDFRAYRNSPCILPHLPNLCTVFLRLQQYF